MNNDTNVVCEDDTTVVDAYGDGCEWYNENTDACGNYDDSDFTASIACCACGGGNWNQESPSNSSDI